MRITADRPVLSRPLFSAYCLIGVSSSFNFCCAYMLLCGGTLNE